MIKKNSSTISVGRRKSSVARVQFKKGNGKILINKRKQLLNRYVKLKCTITTFRYKTKLIGLKKI